MIYCRYNADGEQKYGLVESHHVKEIVPNPFENYEETGDSLPFSEIRFLPPVLPSKIVAVGINYKEHAKEMKHEVPSEPVIFLKPPSAVIGSQDPIRYPKLSGRIDYEGELAVVMKKRAKDISPEDVPGYVLGYTCFNDVTARDLQKKDGQWSRAKGFDSFSPLGPWVVSDLDTANVQVETYLNGELKQRGRTSDMIFDVPTLVSFISRVMTLEPGDVITTGTPPGIGPMKPGDVVDVCIEGIGILRNSVEEA